MKEISEQAIHRSEIASADGAYGNERYSYWRETLSDIPLEHINCGNHGNHAGEKLLDDFVGKDRRKRLYGLHSFLRTGMNFLRLIASVYPVLEAAVVIIHANPPPRAEEFNSMVANHMLMHWKAFEHSLEGKDESRHSGVARIRCAWVKLLELFNGCWCDFARSDTGGGVIIPHYSGGVHVDRQQLVKDMTQAAVKILLRVRPDKPEAGKWTKLGPAVDWLIAAMMPYNLLALLMDKAFGHLKVDTIEPGGDLRELTFHEKSGVRLQGSRRLVADEDELFYFLLLTIALRAIRFVTCAYLRCSKDFHSVCERAPSFDFANPCTSPIVAAMQFLAFIATGRAQHM